MYATVYLQLKFSSRTRIAGIFFIEKESEEVSGLTHLAITYSQGE